jgi:hypothetical protein
MSLYKTLPFLGRLFTAVPPMIMSVSKEQSEINSVIPNVYENLLEFSSYFVGAIRERNL